MTADTSPESSEPRRMRAWLWAVLALFVLAGWSFRVSKAVRDPNLRGRTAAELLVTDPALIHHYTKRVVENGGLPPADFAADTSIEHPSVRDTWTMFTFGQELAIAWVQLLTGERHPQHVVAIWVLGLTAALTVLGVALAAWELTRSEVAALLAGLLFLCLPVNYRTIGFCYIREDFCLPLYALHLWLAARAVRVQSVPALVLAGLSAALAAATWHALGSVLLIQMAAIAAWFLATGQNPLRAPRAWLVPVAATLVGLAIPILRAKNFPLSTPMVVLWALALAGLVARRRDLGRLAESATFAGAAALLLGLSRLGGGQRDYGHVFEFLAAKIRHAGQLPLDPNELTFGTRLLWQGPFGTAPLEVFVLGLPAGILALAALWALRGRAWLGGRGDGRVAVLALFALAALPVTWLVMRTQVLPGMLLPIVLGVVATVLRPPRLALGLALAACAFSGLETWRRVVSQPIPWYAASDPREFSARADLMDWIGANVPAGAPIVTDFLTGAAILAHTGHPITQQPKYETLASRTRIQEFYEAFYQGSLDSLYELMESLDSRYLVVHDLLLRGNAYLGGIAPGAPPVARSPAAAFLHPDPKIRRKIPGVRQVHRTPPELWTPDPMIPSAKIQWFQVYELIGP